jgi:vanillate monooxygenase ferredoxin subunit
VIDVVVARKQWEARNIYSFELVAADKTPLPPFSAGSHIDVTTPSKAVRQYSLCNAAADENSYLIAVLRESAGRGGSASIHDVLKVGDRLTISEPKNHFPLAHHARRSLLFAGGIGITPLLSMAERLSNTGSDFEMHYCARSLERMAFHGRISASNYADRVSFYFDDGDAEQKLQLDLLLSNTPSDTHLYVCGPGGFMNHVLDSARSAGWPPECLHWEFFANTPAAANAGTFHIKIASSGQLIEVAEGQTVIAALSAHGIDVPTSCEQGVCGTCLTRVIEGIPDHKDLFLTPAEQAANDQFLPCCSRAKSAVLVLDL